jgi:hypothetical protein
LKCGNWYQTSEKCICHLYVFNFQTPLTGPLIGPVFGSTSEPTYGSMRAPSGAHDGPMWAHGEALPSRGGMLSPRRHARQGARQLASSYRFVERGASLLAMRPPMLLVFFRMGKAINCCCVASRVQAKLALALAFLIFGF